MVQAGSAASKAGDKVAEKAKEAKKKLGFMQVCLCCVAVKLCHALHMHNGVASAVLVKCCCALHIYNGSTPGMQASQSFQQSL